MYHQVSTFFQPQLWRHVFAAEKHLDCFQTFANCHKFLPKMQASRLPEHLQNIRGLFYAPTSESISGQMAIAAGLASPTELKLYSRKSRSKVNTENKHWLRASLKLWNVLDFQGEMMINHFQKVVDQYPAEWINKRCP